MRLNFMTYNTYLIIKNNTPYEMTIIDVKCDDENDWDEAVGRPDKLFKGMSIDPFSKGEEKAAISARAKSAWLEMEMVFQGIGSDKSEKMRVRINQLEADKIIIGGMQILQEPYGFTCERESGSDKYVVTALVSGSQWMSRVSDEKSLSELTIPGTHDSGSYGYRGIEARWVNCQYYNIKSQLNMGCRFLDIRVKVVQRGKFAIVHGGVLLDLSFADVLMDCLRFLRENPTEAILMSVKEDSPPANRWDGSFEQVLSEYIDVWTPKEGAHYEEVKYHSIWYKDGEDREEKRTKSVWYDGEELPKLGEVRGRIVLFNREAKGRGIHLPLGDDKVTDIVRSREGSALEIYYSDKYNGPWESEKKKAVGDNLRSAMMDTSKDHFYLTFASASAVIWGPYWYAMSINPWLQKTFPPSLSGKKGVVLTDYTGYKDARSLYYSNLRQGADG